MIKKNFQKFTRDQLKNLTECFSKLIRSPLLISQGTAQKKKARRMISIAKNHITKNTFPLIKTTHAQKIKNTIKNLETSLSK